MFNWASSQSLSKANDVVPSVKAFICDWGIVACFRAGDGPAKAYRWIPSGETNWQIRLGQDMDGSNVGLWTWRNQKPGPRPDTATSPAAKSDRTTQVALAEIASDSLGFQSKTRPPVSDEAKPPLPQLGLAGCLPRRIRASQTSQTLSSGGGKHLR
ncbi:uncharacterized protein BO97DRAFT_233532 [Aspergillus homomorphus CBS 101889]|uniref:Uncharacterized protein n=1 Tax=Aspergillus homomorphus (strain CBS 101889) TaxID=1450537 RepID=A0A395HJ75_ASPHC|nr:hypothetical protein BO97DRAFT_233532 [Aspergillus homomorphus CBS 101889]RAL07830.1 hypothetical protein BO97DRAFT_233532 [Aspergillus homomorphus CBS 101889]